MPLSDHWNKSILRSIKGQVDLNRLKYCCVYRNTTDTCPLKSRPCLKEASFPEATFYSRWRTRTPSATGSPTGWRWVLYLGFKKTTERVLIKHKGSVYLWTFSYHVRSSLIRFKDVLNFSPPLPSNSCLCLHCFIIWHLNRIWWLS